MARMLKENPGSGDMAEWAAMLAGMQEILDSIPSTALSRHSGAGLESQPLEVEAVKIRNPESSLLSSRTTWNT